MADPQMPIQSARLARPAPPAPPAPPAQPAQPAQLAQPAQSAQPLAQGELLVTTLLCFCLLCDQIYAPLFK